MDLSGDLCPQFSHSQIVPFSLLPKPENYVLRGHLGTMGSGSQEAILPSFYNCLLMDYSALGIMLSWKLNMNHRHGPMLSEFSVQQRRETDKPSHTDHGQRVRRTEG